MNWSFRCSIVKTILFMAIALTMTVPLSQAAEPQAEFFPVMAWDSSPNDLAYLKRMRECGFTIAGFLPAAALDNCHTAGLKAIVSEPGTTNYDWRNVADADAQKRAAETVAQVRDHPAVFGYYLRDEPPAGMFPGLAKVAAVVKELHPGAWPYINLFPTYAVPAQLEVPDYQTYLDTFVETCKPTILSYDHYAFMEDGSFSEAYFTNLEIMRKTAIKHDLPFWNIIQGLGALHFRVPTHDDLRFQVFTSLAYGARGIAWFQYRVANVGNFRGSAVDQFGTETPTWPRLRNVNLQIEKLGPTLLKLKSDRVYHCGETVPPGCSGPDANSLVKAIAGPMLVGEFTHEDGTRYVMIVNKSLTGSHYCAPQFREPVSKVEWISNFTGEPTAFTGEMCWLAPGQGALLKLNQ